MKEAVDLGPFHLEALAVSAKHSGAGVALAGDNVAVLHNRKLTSELANASAYLHGAAVNFEEPHRCAEVGTWGGWRSQKDRGKGCTNDHGQGDCEGDGEDAAIHWRGLTRLE